MPRRGTTLDTPVRVRWHDLKSDTYSPLRDRYFGGDVSLSVSHLLEYTLQQSDNDACDILFDRFGGPEAVHHRHRAP